MRRATRFAAFVAALKRSEILPMVSASFSIAASAFVPVMVLGIFWRGATRQGAVAGMLCGLGTTLYYLAAFTDAAQAVAPAWLLPQGLWFGIDPVSAGVFGVPAGLVAAWLVSLATHSGHARPHARA